MRMSKNLGEVLDKAPDQGREEPWSSTPDGGIVYLRRARPEELPELYALAQAEIGQDIATYDTVQSLYNHNRDSIWSVYRASDNTRADAKLIGWYGLVYLTQPGTEQLEAGTFDGRDLDLRLVVPTATRPASIYVWVVIARRHARIATWLIANALGAEIYGGVPIYAKAGTTGGLQAIKGYGFAGTEREQNVGKLFRLDRPAPASSSGSSSAA